MKKRPSFTTVIAMLALFIAIGGTATAASGLINGKKIKNGTIAGKKIKNKTITSGKISPATIAALQGARGEKGEKGEKGDAGEKGAKGDAGAPGVDIGITTFTESGTKNNQAANVETSIVDMAGLPGKRYLAMATVKVFSQGTSTVSCALAASNGGGSTSATWNSPVNGSRTTLPLTFTTSVATNHVELTCNPGNSAGSYDGNVVLIPLN